MNFLAHCYLSCENEKVLIGNFITDFLTKKEELQFAGDYLTGIKLHRAIDAFTDRHQASAFARTLLRKRHGKYAPVAVDLIWDYYLSKFWHLYSDATLEDFTRQQYAIFNKYSEVFPQKLKLRYPRMRESHFLMAYANIDNARNSLRWMDKRARFTSDFEGALKDIAQYGDEFEGAFREFFPDVINYVRAFCAC